MKSETFADLGVSEVVCRELKDRGIVAPFPVQEMVIGDFLAGHDLLVQSPTGSGKTLAFGIPLVERLTDADARPSALILAPTRELALQIVEDTRALAHARALSIAAVYGGAGIVKQARLASRAHILVATPGRLLDLIDRRAISLDRTRILILDEADRMLDMGFRPVVDRIVKMTRSDRQTLLFSATLEGEVKKIAAAYTSNPHRHSHAHSAERRGDVEHRFVSVSHQGKIDRLVAELSDRERGLTLVFVRTKRGADRLVKRLTAASLKSVAMHGDKSQSQRERALASFQSGRVDTLVATDVAARGIDVAGITHVINFDMPGSREDYVHRVGRTARAGATGVGITFIVGDQEQEVANMVGPLGLDRELQRAGIATVPTNHRTPAGAGASGGRSPQRRRSTTSPRSTTSSSRNGAKSSSRNGRGVSGSRPGKRPSRHSGGEGGGGGPKGALVASARPSGAKRGGRGPGRSR